MKYLPSLSYYIHITENCQISGKTVKSESETTIPLPIHDVIAGATLSVQTSLRDFCFQRLQVGLDDAVEGRSVGCPGRPAVQHQRVELVTTVVGLRGTIALLHLREGGRREVGREVGRREGGRDGERKKGGG